MLKNAYLGAKIGFDTAANELSKVCPLYVYRSRRWMGEAAAAGVSEPLLAPSKMNRIRQSRLEANISRRLPRKVRRVPKRSPTCAHIRPQQARLRRGLLRFSARPRGTASCAAAAECFGKSSQRITIHHHSPCS